MVGLRCKVHLKWDQNPEELISKFEEYQKIQLLLSPDGWTGTSLRLKFRLSKTGTGTYLFEIIENPFEPEEYIDISAFVISVMDRAGVEIVTDISGEP